MFIKIRYIVSVLCLTLALAGLTSCKSAEKTLGLNPERLDKTRAAIQVEIPDAERRQAMLEVVDSFQADVRKITEEVKAIRLRIVEANRDYDTPREQLQQLYAELGSQLDRLGNAVKEYSLKLRTLCFEAEWDELFAHDNKAFEFKY